MHAPTAVTPDSPTHVTRAQEDSKTNTATNPMEIVDVQQIFILIAPSPSAPLIASSSTIIVLTHPVPPLSFRTSAPSVRPHRSGS
jgi:hypothetical protein